MHPGGELLLCHATGTSFWDIPKGSAQPGETELATALRETAEETGLMFNAFDLIELGRYRYRPVKDLHLFATLIGRIDLSGCSCSTHFRDHANRLRPEMDAFAWVPFMQVAKRCAPNMARLLTQSISLPDVLHRLEQQRA